MAIAGVAISFLLQFLIPNKEGHLMMSIITSVLITMLVWEGNLWIDYWLERQFSWSQKPGKRIMAQLPISMLFSSLAIYASMRFFDNYVCTIPNSHKTNSFFVTSIVVGMLVTLIILSMEVSVLFFGNWKKSLVEVEKYKAESLQAQLKNLKDQVNPHFLFNNLSVLSSLVYINQDKAVDFINQLSKVYRYVLDNKDNELVTLETEIAFIRSYAYLFQIRFDKNIEFHFDISENCYRLLIPPMALQILVENAIKHNEISSEKPLKVCVVAFEDELVVKNNFQLRSNPEPGSNTGLKNICDRYKHFTDRTIQVTQTAEAFEVKIPLLKS
jgi:hypothetical protein